MPKMFNKIIHQKMLNKICPKCSIKYAENIEKKQGKTRPPLFVTLFVPGAR